MELHAVGVADDVLVLRSQRIDLSCQIALTTLIVYNAITRFDIEVKYFWNKPCKFISLIYLSNQYLGIFSMIVSLWQSLFLVDKSLCTFSLLGAFLTETLILLEIDYILLLRVIAIFSQDAKVATCLKLLYSAQGIFVLGTLLYPFCIHHVENTGLAFCEIESGLTPLFQSFRCLGPFAFELVLVSLVAYKSVAFQRAVRGLDGFSLMKVLLQDQVAFFVWIFFCFGTHIMSIFVDPSGMSIVPLTILGKILHGSTLPCVVGSWLIVHLKETADRDNRCDVLGGKTLLSGCADLSSIQFT